MRELRHELRLRGELFEVLPALGRQSLLPTGLADDHALGEPALAAEADLVARRELLIPESGLVGAVDEVARLLELDGEEEGRRDVRFFFPR